jgi:hypothetical protein
MTGSFVFPDGGSYEGDYLTTGAGVIQRRYSMKAGQPARMVTHRFARLLQWQGCHDLCRWVYL